MLGMKRRKILKVFVRALLGVVLFLAAGAGARALLEQFPWTRTETYVASVPEVVSSTLLLAPTTTTLPVEQEPPSVTPPTISLSRTSIEQSDTFAVTLAEVPTGIMPKIAWRDRTYDMAKMGSRWVGLFGADAKQAPGPYTLGVTMGTSTLSRQVTVAKRNFPVTVLAVTPELEAQGYTPPAIQSNVASENERLNTALVYRSEALFSRPFQTPLDHIQIVGAYGNVRKSGSVELQHLGVDLDAEEGTNVYAVNDGVVNLAEEFTNYGKTIVADHGVGIFSFYLHLRELKVKAGDRVTRGQVIAESGNTGYSIGPHLHFSVRIRNTSVDPLRFIEAANAALTGATMEE